MMSWVGLGQADGDQLDLVEECILMSTSTALWGGLMIKGNVCNVESVERLIYSILFYSVQNQNHSRHLFLAIWLVC